MTAEYKVHGDIAVITLNNPPVNGLGLSTRQAIADGVVQAKADAAVKAIIVTGAGKAFSGGRSGNSLKRWATGHGGSFCLTRSARPTCGCGERSA